MTTLRPWQRGAQWLLLGVGLAGVIPVVSKPPNFELGYTAAALVFAVVGWLLTERRPDNGIGWIFLGAWAIEGLFNISGAATDHALATNDFTSWWAWLGAWLPSWMFGMFLLLATTLPLLLFPEGFAGPRWRWVAVAGIAGALVSVVCGMISPVLGIDRTPKPTIWIDNPLSPSFLAGSGMSDGWLLRNLGLGLVALTAVVAAVGVVRRAHRATGVERLQFRWVAFAAVIMAVLLLLTFLPQFADTGGLGKVTWAVAIATLPVAMGVAILRFHLYDIDRIISRTTSYALVTGLLLATYLVVIGVVTSVVGEKSSLAVAAATLTAAALARPALRRVQGAVDRRFNRARYDAVHTVDEFGHKLRSEVEPEQIERDLVAAVDATIQPSTVSLWLRE